MKRIVLVLFLLLPLSSCNGGSISGNNVPSALKKRVEGAMLRLMVMVDGINAAYRKDQTKFKEESRSEMNILANLALMNIKAASLAIRGCEHFSIGSYCDDAAEDLDDADEELKKISKFYEKVKPDVSKN